MPRLERTGFAAVDVRTGADVRTLVYVASWHDQASAPRGELEYAWLSSARVCGSVSRAVASQRARRRRCSGSLESNDDVRAAVEGARLAARLDLELEEALVPRIVARGEQVRSRCGDDPTWVSSEQLLEAAPAIQAKDVALVEFAVEISCLEDVDDSSLPSELIDESLELFEEGAAVPSSDMTVSRTLPPCFVTRRSSARARSASPRT